VQDSASDFEQYCCCCLFTRPFDFVCLCRSWLCLQPWISVLHFVWHHKFNSPPLAFYVFMSPFLQTTGVLQLPFEFSTTCILLSHRVTLPSNYKCIALIVWILGHLYLAVYLIVLPKPWVCCTCCLSRTLVGSPFFPQTMSVLHSLFESSATQILLSHCITLPSNYECIALIVWILSDQLLVLLNLTHDFKFITHIAQAYFQCTCRLYV
jgi:hypothetical protein